MNDAPPLQFISPSTIHDGAPSKNPQALRVIRSQAMRDYVWKENHPSAGEGIRTKRTGQRSHMGRFKINTKASGTEKESPRNKKPRSLEDSETNSFRSASKSLVLEEDLDSLLQRQVLLGSQVDLGKRFNPFDATLLGLGPKSEKLVFYYHEAYSMNMAALNFQNDCLTNAISDPALLHAILYIVATDYDLHQGVFDSALTIHHGGEAIRLVNKQLYSGELTDTLAAAVAIIATRENLNGRFHISGIHMNGLQHMIAKRGGLQSIQGIHRQVVAWSDFYDSNLRNRRLRFCQPPIRPRHIPKKLTIPTMLDAEAVFGTESPIVPVIHTLRRLSLSLEPDHSTDLDKAMASLSIYDIEYDLNQLNGEYPEAGDNMDGVSEVGALKTAAHMYLYLVIRQIPSGSPAYNQLSRRLRADLEEDEQWWGLNRDRQCWLLWILFIGYMATSEVFGRRWFFMNALRVCKVLGVSTSDELLGVLMSVVWDRSRGRAVDLFWREGLAISNGGG